MSNLVPVSVVAKAIGVCDRTVRNTCRRLGIGKIGERGWLYLTEEEITKLASARGCTVNWDIIEDSQTIPEEDESDEEFIRLACSINPREPCPAKPGTFLKMAYIRARYIHGLPLYHPDDAPLL